jgi:hypothetical protein
MACPFCNSSFALLEVPASGRVACPRCGEAVPVRVGSEDGEPIATGGPAATMPQTAGVPVSTQYAPPARKWSTGRAVAIALGMGLVGLLVGLFVYYRTPARPAPDDDDAPLATATPPAELAGLGYLPADCNLIFAIQPGPLVAHAQQTNQDPREMLAQVGVPEGVFATLDRVGVTLQQIDHIAGGTRIGDTEQEIRLAVALVLRRPLANEDQFLHGLEARKAPTGQPHYVVKIDRFSMVMAKAGDRGWVFGLDEKDLEAATRGGSSQLSPGLREMLAERLPPDAAVWAAADADRWAAKPLVKFAAGAMKRPELLSLVAKAQAAVVGLSVGESPRVRLFVRCTDADTGEKLRAYFKSKATTDATRTGGAGEWAMFDAPADPQNALAPLRPFLDDMGK